MGPPPGADPNARTYQVLRFLSRDAGARGSPHEVRSSSTAESAAAARDQEGLRPDGERQIGDPFAPAFLGPVTRLLVGLGGSRLLRDAKDRRNGGPFGRARVPALQPL